ncbi:MAG TPA: XRE family transcriptional regulator [Paludibacteraceae bacterium]|nr:XRE family transcriptional regulator [Paludibacteraceae bacterium]
MNEQIRQIALRLRGLRESLDLTISEAAEKCGVPKKDYEKYESGETDIPVSFICKVAETFGIETTALISGEEPRAQVFFVTRKGTGASIERTKAYKYQALAYGFRNAKVDPFEVMVEPNNLPIYLNTHKNQEFNYILEGTLLLEIDGKQLTLYEGDSIYFDATKPHGMKALNDKKVRFLAIII